MNIKAVIVDELPKSAVYCPMFEVLHFEKQYELKFVHVRCNISRATWTTNFFDYETGRCPKCPLVTDGSELPQSYKPVKVIYNGITTIVIFSDGTKVISRPSEDEWFDRETGLAMCIAKRVYGGRGKFLQAVNSATVQNPVEEDVPLLDWPPASEWIEAMTSVLNHWVNFGDRISQSETDEQ